MADVTNDPAREAAEKIIANLLDPTGGDISTDKFASIIRTAFDEALPELIEPPRRFNWARQNYCSGWNQCVHAMRRRLGLSAAIDAARKQDEVCK